MPHFPSCGILTRCWSTWLCCGWWQQALEILVAWRPVLYMSCMCHLPLVLAGSQLGFLVWAVALPPVPDSFLKGPYLQNVTPTGVTVMWETVQEECGRLEYGSGRQFDRAVSGVSARIHELRIRGLMPNRWYRYRAWADGKPAEGVFHTAPTDARPFRFAVWGDNQEYPVRHARGCELMRRHCPDLAISVGDVVTDGRNYDQWGKQFFEPARELLRTTPAYVAMGNHHRNAHWFYDFFSFPAPRHENYYAFTYGGARFVVIDSIQELSPAGPQYSWLVREMKSPAFQRATWRFTFFHTPPWSEGWPEWAGDEEVRRWIVPLHQQYGVTASFSGHTHDYERGFRDGTCYIVTGGGAGSLDPWARDYPHVTVYHSTWHFCLVDVGLKSLRLRAIDYSGRCIDDVTLGR